MSSDGTAKGSDSRFLNLPPELRNRIYEHTFARGVCYVLQADSIYPGIVRTNRQIRAESLSLFLTTSEFRFLCRGDEDWELITEKLNAIPEWQQRMINRVVCETTRVYSVTVGYIAYYPDEIGILSLLKAAGLKVRDGVAKVRDRSAERNYNLRYQPQVRLTRQGQHSQ